MLNVNIIEFEGERAVINSYSDHPLLVESCEKQLAEWKARFPNAKVTTERMHAAETIALVAHGRAQGDHLYHHCWEVGRRSQA